MASIAVKPSGDAMKPTRAHQYEQWARHAPMSFPLRYRSGETPYSGRGSGDDDAPYADVWGDRYRGAAAGSAGDHRGKGPQVARSDARIQDDVSERLTEDPDIDASDIVVHCRDGVVTLEGTVDIRSLKHRAEDLAASSPGVTDVDNRLKIAPSSR